MVCFDANGIGAPLVPIFQVPAPTTLAPVLRNKQYDPAAVV
jgi:hypothetical protein